MRTEGELYDIIAQAMYKTMHAEWAKLPQEEQDAYRLNMHGLEMYVSKKNTKTDQKGD